MRPMISRSPCSLIPMAMLQLFETTRASSLTLIYKTSVMTYGYFVSESERFCQAATIGSSCLTRSGTKDLETLLPQSSSTIFETFRVETPEIYLSNMEANKEIGRASRRERL